MCGRGYYEEMNIIEFRIGDCNNHYKIIKWCKENKIKCTSKGCCDVAYNTSKVCCDMPSPHSVYYTFYDKIDAVSFKLRWI